MDTDRVGVFDALSVSTARLHGDPETVVDEARHITCMKQVDDDDGSDEKHEPVTRIDGVRTLTLPDNTHPPSKATPTFGYDDEFYWVVTIDDEAAGAYRIQRADG